jgi:hypothetical protein
MSSYIVNTPGGPVDAYELLSKDAVLSKMEDPSIQWGDLFTSESFASFAAGPSICSKDIPLKFPVFLRGQPCPCPCPCTNKLGIQWNKHKLSEWRKLHPNPLEWKQYEYQTAKNMVTILQESGWVVSEPSAPMFLCSIERRPVSAVSAESWVYTEPECPVMLCMNDIKVFFPVIWHALHSDVSGAKCKTYIIELYRDKIQGIALCQGVNVLKLTDHLASLLTTTLAQSPAWEVRPSENPSEHCRLYML